MINTKFVFAVSLVAILAVSSSMAASVTDVAPATGEGQAISGTTGTVGDVYDWSKWSGYATEGIASVNYVNNAVDAAGNAAQWAENHAAAAGTAALNAEQFASQADAAAKEAKGALSSLDVSDTAKTGQYVSAVSQADGKITVSRGSLPTVNNATLTIERNGETVGTFTANASKDKTIDITVPTGALASKNTITNADVADNAAIAQSKISGLTDALGGKQEMIGDLATIRSGAAAGATALQKADIATGTSDGTISVDGTNVAVRGLGSAAYTASTAYATAEQGTLASSAVQPEDLAKVATSGSYNDLADKPTIPTVNNATLTIKNGATNTNLATFTANQSSAATATIPAATPSVAGLSKIGVIPSGSATSTTYATIWVE